MDKVSADETLEPSVEDVRNQLIELFKTIEVTRMDGVPVLNKKLSVDAIGFEPFGDFYLGVLLTPWFMNLMMLPMAGHTDGLEGQKFGSKQSHALPNGQFQFIVGHEEAIGFYLSCSLFSPVFEFADQESALQTAQAALDEVLRVRDDEDEPDEDHDMKEIWAGRLPTPADETSEDSEVREAFEEPERTGPPVELSRRDVLRGFRSSPEPLDETDVENQA